MLIDALKYLRDQKKDIEMMSRNVNYLLMMSKVFLEEDMQESNNWRFKENQEAKQALIEARYLQTEVIDKCRELGQSIDRERVLAAEISFKLGKYFEEREGNYADAVTAYNDCLKRKEDHANAMLSLARIQQQNGSNDQCAQYCQRLLKIDPSNEQATSMLANLKLMQESPEGAM